MFCLHIFFPSPPTNSFLLVGELTLFPLFFPWLPSLFLSHRFEGIPYALLLFQTSFSPCHRPPSPKRQQKVYFVSSLEASFLPGPVVLSPFWSNQGTLFSFFSLNPSPLCFSGPVFVRVKFGGGPLPPLTTPGTRTLAPSPCLLPSLQTEVPSLPFPLPLQSADGVFLLCLLLKHDLIPCLDNHIFFTPAESCSRPFFLLFRHAPRKKSLSSSSPFFFFSLIFSFSFFSESSPHPQPTFSRNGLSPSYPHVFFKERSSNSPSPRFKADSC